MSRILVTGSRLWTDTAVLFKALSEHVAPDDIVVHGKARRGTDDWTNIWCRNTERRVEPHPAEWWLPCGPDCTHRRANGTYPCAGRVRNQRMVDLGAIRCLAFIVPGEGNSRGTWDCIGRAEAAGIEVLKFTQGVSVMEGKP